MRKRRHLIAVLLLISVVSLVCSTVWTQGDISALVKQVRPAVVLITTEESQGSGFVINSKGYILTSYHVVQRASTIKVKTNSGIKYNASLVDYSETLEEGGSDLALLKIEEEHLPTVELGNSNELRIGNSIIALGYPLGSFSVNTGILSSKLGEGDEKILQISAPINPGNSGGPLVNKRGEVIGIVFSKASAKGFLEKYGFIPEGIAFAIPINTAKRLFKITIGGLPEIPKRRPPVAEFTFTPNNPEVEQGIIFNATSSYDPNGYIKKCEWDFNDDGRIDKTGTRVIHLFSREGSHSITLTVTDSEGLSDSGTRIIKVRQRKTVEIPEIPELMESFLIENTTSSHDAQVEAKSSVEIIGAGRDKTMIKGFITISNSPELRHLPAGNPPQS